MCNASHQPLFYFAFFKTKASFFLLSSKILLESRCSKTHPPIFSSFFSVSRCVSFSVLSPLSPTPWFHRFFLLLFLLFLFFLLTHYLRKTPSPIFPFKVTKYVA